MTQILWELRRPPWERMRSIAGSAKPVSFSQSGRLVYALWLVLDPRGR